MRQLLAGFVLICEIAAASAQNAAAPGVPAPPSAPAAPAVPASPASPTHAPVPDCTARRNAVAMILGKAAIPVPTPPEDGYRIEGREVSVDMGCNQLGLSVSRDLIYGPTPPTYFGLMIKVVAAYYKRPPAAVTAEINRCVKGAVFSPLPAAKTGRTRAGMRATRNIGTLTASGIAYTCTFYGNDRRFVEISTNPAG